MLTNFSYLIEDELAGCAHPLGWGGSAEGLEELRERGIGAIVSLEEDGIPAYLIADLGMHHMHVPIPDFGTPSIEDALALVDFIRREVQAGNAVAVHCRAGYGRTGTALACYLVATGEGAERAIHRVRRARPGSIETAEQEGFVRHFEREFARRQPTDAP
jgi:atypical dual specificity phosphatase